ncbi:MAG: hypothetical protein ACO3LZ_04115 [Candidatus Nanopelagicales bacterium]
MKRGRLSADERLAIGIPEDERLIAWGEGEPDEAQTTLVAATDQALYEQRSGTRIPWADVIKGTWEQPDLVVDFQGGAGVRRIRIRVGMPRDLPAAVRDRVTDTVVVSEYRELGDDAGAHFVARRTPGGGLEEITWSVVFDSGLDSTDATLRSKADRILGELRSSLGV